MGPLGVAVAGCRVAVGAAGRLVGVGGTVVGVGVSVTSGVGVTVGVSVGVGVGVSTGVGECVGVGVKVGLGVLVAVGVAVGDAKKDVKEQPKRPTITRKASRVAAAVPASFGAVILKPIDLLSSVKPCYCSLVSESGSWKTSRLWKEARPDVHRQLLPRADGKPGILGFAAEDYACVLTFQCGSSPQWIGLRKWCWVALTPDHSQCVLAEGWARGLELELSRLHHLTLIAHGAVLYTEHWGVQLDRYQITVNRIPLGILDVAPDLRETVPGVAEVLLGFLYQFVLIHGLWCVCGRRRPRRRRRRRRTWRGGAGGRPNCG